MPMPKKHSPRTIRGRNSVRLRLGAVLEQRRHDLTVGDPVRRHRRPGRQQLLGDDEPFQVGPPVSAVLDRNGHAQPAACGECGGELLVPAATTRRRPTGCRSRRRAARPGTRGRRRAVRRWSSPVDGGRWHQPGERHQRVRHFSMRRSCSASWCASGCMAAAMPSVDSSIPVRDSCSRRLAIRNACGGFLAIRSARSFAA